MNWETAGYDISFVERLYSVLCLVSMPASLNRVPQQLITTYENDIIRSNLSNNQ